MASHALYDHAESHEQMKTNFNDGMAELDRLEKELREEMNLLDKILGA